MPTEDRRVVGVSEDQYSVNELCAVPGCFNKPTETHHCFRRSAIGGDYWWVLIQEPEDGPAQTYAKPIPHVVGLCHRHHNDVTTHLAWIKLTDEGFEWLERVENEYSMEMGGTGLEDDWADWEGMGLLDPQPGQTEKEEPVPGKPCPRCRRRVPEPFKGEKKRKRIVKSVKVPQDEQEDGIEILDSLLEQAAAMLGKVGQPVYYVLIAVLWFFITNYREEETES